MRIIGSVELSCKTEYALLALLELADHYNEGEPLQIRQIAAQQTIPDRYLEQLLATLRRGNLVRSQRGAKGGYILAREPWKITLLDVINCLEGSESKVSTSDTTANTVESAVVEEIWQEVHDRANEVLREYTLQDLCEKRDNRRQLNIMYYI
ncbi:MULTISPECIES: RrF2 family transcriptional regulator [unclassified Coleofasciculus]|uniref:RrF2 family transcriptional regulator n=1 Tax=unclassified Coleofasciculus TaxID=2692782 RepID=UPI0018802CAE|nr:MULTISPECIES: Rrf2 family transcriptional regulator [unclassified Coleofasciculus]MBE9128068.1 Rrf2 family transcriptional regulator [Coleofasciculus sp. LEGE 07081]MBE9149329.1 Rrf2 family transcriptional regulator [Coleofasciculus sp. LEGE 07092]